MAKGIVSALTGRNSCYSNYTEGWTYQLQTRWKLSLGSPNRMTSKGLDVTSHMARIRVIGEILHIFPLAPKVWEIGDPKRLTRVRPNLVVGRGMTDRQTDRRTDRQTELP